jgi:hypothetical protein
MRSWSVDPIGAVYPSRARVSMTMPPVLAALARGLGADLGLPPLLHLVFQARAEVRAGPLDLVLHVSFHGALGDLQHLRDRLGVAQLLDQAPHLRAGGLQRRAG